MRFFKKKEPVLSLERVKQLENTFDKNIKLGLDYVINTLAVGLAKLEAEAGGKPTQVQKDKMLFNTEAITFLNVLRASSHNRQGRKLLHSLGFNVICKKPNIKNVGEQH